MLAVLITTMMRNWGDYAETVRCVSRRAFFFFTQTVFFMVGAASLFKVTYLLHQTGDRRGGESQRYYQVPNSCINALKHCVKVGFCSKRF